MLGNYKVFAALHDEAREGWVWLPSTPSLTPGIVSIRNPRNGRSVVCEMRVADKNFQQVYNGQEGTSPLPEEGNFIVIGDWYRRSLGILKTKSDIPLEIEEANGWWAKYVSLFVQHPAPLVRTSIALGLVSIGLGLIGLLLGILSVALSAER